MNDELPETHGGRRWWRSRLFWLGVPGLAFLGWAWIDSNRQTSSVEYRPQGIQMSSTHGRLVGVQLPEVSAASFRVDEWLAVVYPSAWTSTTASMDCFGGLTSSRTLPKWGFDQYSIHPVQRTWFPSFRFQRSEDPARPFTLLAIPYWGLGALYLGLWLGVAVWWRCRKARLMGGSDGGGVRPPSSATPSG